jgi:hypothetical protein
LKAAGEAENRFAHLRKAMLDTPGADAALLADLQGLHEELNSVLLALRGDPEKEKRNVFQPPSISERVDRIAGSQWNTTSGPTATNRDDYRYASEAFGAELDRLRKLMDGLVALEKRFEEAGAPWTPGRRL